MGRMLDAVERARRERLKNVGSEVTPIQVESGAQEKPPQSDPLLRPVTGAKPLAAQLIPAGIPVGVSDLVIGAHDQQSPVAEQVRQIRTNLEAVLADYSSRTIVITSPVAGDGKTLVAANLATILADDPNHEVLLVDADMRKPDIHTLFGLRQTPGLSDYLQGRAPLEQVIQRTMLPNFKIMAGGRSPHNPTVLLSPERVAALQAELQSRFQWVVFDTPPLLPVTDASLLARASTGLILVVRLGKTNFTVIERAQEMLGEMRLPVLGCILNDLSQMTGTNDYYSKYYRRRGSNVEV